MREMRILLVEPGFPNRFPPLGLLKIGSYHLEKGDEVTFTKGLWPKARGFFFDRIYISTLFSFHHSLTVRTILHYKDLLKGDLRRLFVGGIHATLNSMAIFNETGVFPHVGLLNRPGILGNDHVVIDALSPAYGLLETADYSYDLKDAYFGYSTRGCPNRCKFCAVPMLEPTFVDYIDLKPYIASIVAKYGEKQHLVLMDNNVLASGRFPQIISDIRSLGFEQGAKRLGKKRTVDFNQGLDANRINPQTARLLSEICIEPFRLAYDSPREFRGFERAVRVLEGFGQKKLSTYVLYNFSDTPLDLYTRLSHVIDLNAALGTHIYSFPMRYTPLDARDRKYVGPSWTAKHIRGLQCILNVTKGLVSHRQDFFYRAFGNDYSEFEQILLMPDRYILNRLKHENNGALDWRTTFKKLTPSQKDTLLSTINSNDKGAILKAINSSRSFRMKSLLGHHLEKR